MTEYITKEQAINVVNTAFGHIYDTDSETVSLVDLQNEIVMTIEQNTEPADVAPVRHGRWTRIDYHDARCSECGHKTYYPDRISLYCPECGARMDGGKSNAD